MLASIATFAQTSQIPGAIIQLGQSVHVSAALPSTPHYEVEIAANPLDARQLIACSMAFPNDLPAPEVVTYVSSDGGKTWKLTLRTGGDGNQSWDPDCKYGPGNVVYSLSEGLGQKYPEAYDRIDRSIDGGRTWQPFTRAIHAERSFITVDRWPGSRYGWLYLYGMGDGAPTNPEGTVRIGYSPDGGKTIFTQSVSLGRGVHVVDVGPGVMLSDGTLVLPVPVYTLPRGDVLEDQRIRTPGLIKIVRAKYQQAGWPLKVDTSTLTPWLVDLQPNGSYYTTLAADASNGPFRDRIYAVWEQHTSGRSQVVLSFSADEGKTWSHPQVLDDDIPRQVGDTIRGPDDIHGTVAVNPQGAVGVMWLDRRNYLDDLGWAVRFRASLDGGETFCPSVQVSKVDYDPRRGGRVALWSGGAWAPTVHTTNSLSIPWFVFHGGHTMGLTADADGGFHPLWVANPTGVAQVWTTRVVVSGIVEKNGDPQLAQLVDASKLVRLVFLNRFYDLRTHSLDFDLQLKNVSHAEIRGPLKVRVLSVGSYVGSVTIQAGGTQKTVEGTVWGFADLRSSPVFEPGDVTKPLHIHFIVHGIDPFSQIGYFRFFETPLAILTTKVLVGSIDAPRASQQRAR